MLGALMLASLVMSVAIPEAFGERGLMFALAYVAIQLVRTVFAVLALEASHPLRRVMCNELDQQVRQVAQRSAKGVVDPLAQGVCCDLGRQTR